MSLQSAIDEIRAMREQRDQAEREEQLKQQALQNEAMRLYYEIMSLSFPSAIEAIIKALKHVRD